MTLAKNLKALRDRRGISQGELAKLTGISQQSLSRLENGRDLTSKNLPKIASALGVSVSDLDPNFHVMAPEDWRSNFTRSISMAVDQGVTLTELRSQLDRSFSEAVVSKARSGIGELSPDQVTMFEEVYDILAGKKGSRDLFDKEGT